MKKIGLVLAISFLLVVSASLTFMNYKVWALSTVFSDDFSTNSSATFTTTGLIGASSFSVNRSGADWGARRNTSPAQLELTNDAGATANADGWVYASTPTTSFTSPYNSTLNLTPAKVTWNFNLRQIRPDPAGFGSNSYGAAFILGTTSTTAATAGDGYAVVLGQSGAVDPVRLAKFTGGLRGTLTNIITSNTAGLADFGAEYLSVRVTYDPVGNIWELFLRNDGNSAFADPASGTLTSQGTAPDSTYTGTSLTSLGGYWQGSTAANQTAFFDNISVTVADAGTNLTINDVSLNEGNAGTTSFTFTVSLSAPAGPGGVTFDIATQDNTATQPSDYTLKTLTSQTIPQNSSTYTFTVLVNGDTALEPNETFFVNVTNVTGATVTDAQGQGTIVNDDAAPTPPPTPTPTPSLAGTVVISQVYGGGGNTGATLKNDFIELINHSALPVDLTGWSVQYASATLANWQVTTLPSFVLQPGQYFLIQEAAGAGGTDNLPTPDATGTIAVGSTSGKVALVSNTTALIGNCPAGSGIIDFVGYDGANCFEGAGAAPLLSNTTAALRLDEGCFDTNDNSADFVAGAPNPRNSLTTTHNCTGLFAVGSANPNAVLEGAATTLRVDVSPGQNPPSTGITVTANLSSIGGSPSQSFSGSGNVFTFNATVSLSTTAGMKSLPVTITDAQSRSFNANILLSVLPLVPNHITISQVYGGGGNGGATYANDFVELYNPTAATVNITGWSLQYASATGTSWTNKQPLGGIIGPGEYYLVSLASGGAVGAPLPPSNISGGINMSATAGKIALVSNGAALAGACPLGGDPDIVDFVGYGTTANCHEGTANTPAPSNTTAIFRKDSGATDTDQNGTDFSTGGPIPRRTAPIVELGPWVADTDPITDGFNAPYDATVTVSFSEPVTLDSGWYNITCTSGSHNDATVASFNSSKGFHITPNTSFQFGEQCTVTIFKDKVHDQDTDDSSTDTDTLFENYTWSFTVVGAGQPAPYPPSVHLTLGNPSGATPGDPNNYLMEKPTFTLSYNRDKGTPNWVSWHMDLSWYGTLARIDTFRADPRVPPEWYRVQESDYSGTGFDRGHMTPNADRDNQNRIPINQETFLMTNMVPQSPDNNQGPWAAFEEYLRTLTDAGQELYIVSGPVGVGGSGSNGGTTNTITGGHVTVPAYTWKVVLVLPQGENDLSRATCSARTIAILIPNVQGIRNNAWQTYLTSVDAIEAATGYNLFSNLSDDVQNCIEPIIDGISPRTVNQSATNAEDTPVTITLQATRPNNNNLTFSIVGTGPAHGALGSISAAACAGSDCTATVTYSPGLDYNGADSFKFKANNGAADSNISTVSLSVTEVNDVPVAANDAKATNQETPLNFPAGDLTTNDSAGPANEGSQTLTVTSVTATANTHGTVTLSSGTVTYSPAANYSGLASFSYQVCDNGTTNSAPDSKCATGTVNVTINAKPTIAGATIARQQGVAASTSQIATASDAEQPANTVTVTVNGGASATVNGVTVNSISVDGAGNVTASVAADCTASNASFTLTATDNQGATSSSTLTVNVTANTPPTLGTYPNAAVLPGGSTTVTPNAVPSDNVAVVSLTASAPGFTGTFAGNTASGVITVTGATPAGSYTVTVTATDNCGATATRTFTLIVNTPPSVTGATITQQQGAPASVSQIGVVSDADQPANTLILTINGGASATVNGVTVSGLSINGAGQVLASVSASCSASNASFNLSVTDNQGATANATLTVNVTPSTAPIIVLKPAVEIWPPNGKFETFAIADMVLSASDGCDGSLINSVVIEKVTSDEGTNSSGDILIAANCKSVQLRRDRDGNGDGRVYTVTLRVQDSSGNITRANFLVTVPHSQNGSPAVNSGVAYTVASSCGN